MHRAFTALEFELVTQLKVFPVDTAFAAVQVEVDGVEVTEMLVQPVTPVLPILRSTVIVPESVAQIAVLMVYA